MPAQNARSHRDHRPGRLQPPPGPEPAPTPIPAAIEARLAALEQRVAALTAAVALAVPPTTGTIIRFAAASLPGFLPCDGGSYFISDFPALFTLIGTKFNRPNDPDNQFRVPNISSAPVFEAPFFIKT